MKTEKQNKEKKTDVMAAKNVMEPTREDIVLAMLL